MVKNLNYKDYFHELLGNKKVLAVVEFFLTHPLSQHSQREIIKSVKLAKATGVNVLGHLEKLGFVEVQHIGRTNLYSLNRDLLFVRQLKRFYNITSHLVDELIAPFRDVLVKAVLFGSFARGEDREDSDIDVLLVGDLQEEDVVRHIERLSSKYKKKISAIIRTQEYFITMPAKEKVLWNKLVAGGEVIYESRI